MTYSEFRNQFKSAEAFRRAYGALSEEEARALINAETAPTHIKARMYDTWLDSVIEFRLKNTEVFYSGVCGLRITFYEDDSEFDGNDFTYTCGLDAVNTEKFLMLIPDYVEVVDDPDETVRSKVKKWLTDNINCGGIGGDLIAAWAAMGLNGSRTIREDYPGGIYRVETF